MKNTYTVDSPEQISAILYGLGYTQPWFEENSLSVQLVKDNGSGLIMGHLFIYEDDNDD